MNNTVKVALLVVVIVACLGFVVFRLMGGKSSGASGGAATNVERDMYCLECKTAYKAKLDDNTFQPLMMAGPGATPKHTCANCGKAGGIAGIKCGSCGEISPSPGMQMMMPGPGGRPKGAVCPKCKKPLVLGTGSPAMGGESPSGAGPAQ